MRYMLTYALLVLVPVLIWLAVLIRAVLRPHREPASRVAWVAVIAALPGFGILIYLLLGETNIGRKRLARVKAVLASLPPVAPLSFESDPRNRPSFPERCAPLFRLGESVNGFRPVGGNTARLLGDSNSAIDAMVADMDRAEEHIHLIFYIWLEDNNGLKVIEALKRAAARGVACRALADGLGSRALIRSRHWKEMKEAGVKPAVALPIGFFLLRPFRRRIDLRNHRKIVIIDNRITYCGSQNCADPEFRLKPRFAPWVDALIRFVGPVARQNQHIFVGDWMTCVDEDIRPVLEAPMPAGDEGFPAQVIATGPTIRNSAMPETFETLMHAARKRLMITTPYYVPNESMQAALCAAARRGVETTIIFPARNDSWQVAAASRSYYLELVLAGVTIYEFAGGLLHTKSMTIDDDITLIGSANMDRRSFDLNYENNILFCDAALTVAVRERQAQYLASSKPVDLDDINGWSIQRRFWNNLMGMLGPVL
ncbi:MAG: cardiolipin synthase [Lysobacterales bacterium]